MHLNEWTEQAERWIDLAAWDACSMAADLEDLRGRRCFGGLDLSTTTDVTALAWVFPPDHDHGLWHVLSRYFVPEDNPLSQGSSFQGLGDRWDSRAIPVGQGGAFDERPNLPREPPAVGGLAVEVRHLRAAPAEPGHELVRGRAG